MSIVDEEWESMDIDMRMLGAKLYAFRTVRFSP